MQDAECREYVTNGNFKADFNNVLAHDKEMFEDPKGWQDNELQNLPIFKDTVSIWSEIAPIYRSELSELAFEEIPAEDKVLESFKTLVGFIL